MTDLNEVLLVKLSPDAAASSRRLPTGFAYCDTGGNVHVPDYVAIGPLARMDIEKCGDVIIAQYPSDKHLVVLGVVGGAAVNAQDESKRILSEIKEKGMDEYARAKIAAAYLKLRGKMLVLPRQPQLQQRPIVRGFSLS